MARFFISYARADGARVDALVRAIEFLGHDVWIDRELVGGHKWWEAILENIRRCDVFVAALSVEFLDSKPCRVEQGYACALGKVTFPVVVSDVPVELLPSDLAAIQFIDYRVPNEQAALTLAKAVAGLSAPKALPDPLPAAPELAAPNVLHEPPKGEAGVILPTMLRGPASVLLWTAVVLFVVFPIALLGAAIVLVVVSDLFQLNVNDLSRWGLALVPVIGWFVWRVISSRLKRGIGRVAVWWRRRRALATAK